MRAINLEPQRFSHYRTFPDIVSGLRSGKRQLILQRTQVNHDVMERELFYFQTPSSKSISVSSEASERLAKVRRSKIIKLCPL